MTRKIKREGEAELHACMHMRQKKSRKGKKDKKEEEEWGWKRTTRRPWTDDGWRREGFGRVASASFA